MHVEDNESCVDQSMSMWLIDSNAVLSTVKPCVIRRLCGCGAKSLRDHVQCFPLCACIFCPINIHDFVYSRPDWIQSTDYKFCSLPTERKSPQRQPHLRSRRPATCFACAPGSRCSSSCTSSNRPYKTQLTLSTAPTRPLSTLSSLSPPHGT